MPIKKAHQKPISKREQKLMEKIKRDNAAYAEMTPLQRRLVVAKEVLLMIKMGTFVPGNGYGEVTMIKGEWAVLPPIDPKFEDDGNMLFPLGDLQPVIRAGGFECEGCAKAAIIVARAAVGNKVKISRRNMNHDGSAKTIANSVSKEVFGGSCSDLIEALYENWYMDATDFIDRVPRKERDRAREISRAMFEAYTEFRQNLPSRSNPYERMKAIYANIVKNGGHLVIGDFKY